MLHTWSDEEVTLAWRMIADEGKIRKDLKTRKLKGVLKPGDKVKFESTKNGTTRGKIIRVKTKNAVVDVKGRHWNVPMSMLTKV
jgi:hypothetical protein